MLSFLKKLVFLTICLSVFTYAVNFWLGQKDYIFKETDIKRIGKKYIDYKGTVKQMVDAIHKDFQNLHFKDIVSKEDLGFFFFGQGGFKGSMYLLHASLTEYLLVFATPLDTSGHSVRQWVNRTDVVLAGQIKQWSEGMDTVVTHLPGHVVSHEWGSESMVEYSAGLVKLSYGRGFVLGSVPHYITSVLFHSHDFSTFFRTMALYAKCLYKHCLAHCSCLSFLA